MVMKEWFIRGVCSVLLLMSSCGRSAVYSLYTYLHQSWKKRVLQNQTFFRFSAISVLFSAKFLPNLSKFYQISPNFTKVYKSLPNFTKFNQIKVQISDLRNFVALFQIVVIYAFFFRQICIPKKSGLTKKANSEFI